MSETPHILQLELRGSDTFFGDDSWIRGLLGKHICRHCKWFSGAPAKVDVMVEDKPRSTDIDFIGMQCFGLVIVSKKLIDWVGRATINKTLIIGSVLDVRGFEHASHRSGIAKRDNVLVRGGENSSVGLCKVCDRILYWPVGRKYVLRDCLPASPFFASEGELFCTPEFYSRRLAGRRLTRVARTKIAILDRPVDGLPVSRKEIRAHCRVTGNRK